MTPEEINNLETNEGQQITVQMKQPDGGIKTLACRVTNRTERRVCNNPRWTVYYTETVKCDDGQEWTQSGSYDGGKCTPCG